MRRILLPLLIALSVAAPGLRAQDTSRVDPDTKIPTTARIYGIIPGLGQVYAGEVVRGVALYFATAGLIAAAGMGGLDCFDESSEDGCHGRAMVALVGGLVTWSWGIYDAGRAAERANARRGLRVSVFVGSRVAQRRVSVGVSIAPSTRRTVDADLLSVPPRAQ